MAPKVVPDKEEQELLEQEDKGRRIFWTVFGFLIAWIIFLIILQFGVYNITTKQPEWARYLIWIFAALMGASTYLLWNVAFWFQKIRAEDKKGRADFKKYGLWYVSTMTRAPILTIILLWIFTKTEIKFGDTTLDFTKIDHYILLGVAFILGYYGRVALSQLDIITKTFFPKAWALATQGFEVTAPKILLLKEKFTFATEPITDVVWSATPMGTMEAGTGTYTAPDDPTKDGELVIIRASLKNEPSVTGIKEVTLKLFKISGTTEVKPGGIVKLSLETKLTDKLTDAILGTATWSTDDPNITLSNGKEVEFTAPTLATNDKDKKEIKITATLTLDQKTYSAEVIVTVKPA